MARRGGWRRRGRKQSFRYEDAHGRPIAEEASLERISALVIPPAWKDVWISPSASAKLQATGVDAAGRRQYLYHPDYRAAQERAKYDRLVRFGELLPSLRGDVSRHSAGEPLSYDWTAAHAVTLINRAWFRVGSERYAKTSRTYGVTTLRKRHVKVRGQRLTFTFRAKHRIAEPNDARRCGARRGREDDARASGRLEALPDRRGRHRRRPHGRDAERLPRRAPRRGVHGQGLPHLGRQPDGRDRARRARAARSRTRTARRRSRRRCAASARSSGTRRPWRDRPM